MSSQAASDDMGMAAMSAVTGVSPDTLRYYERVGLLRPVPRSTSGRRCYQPCDVEWVRFLLRLRDTGMSIAAMRRYADLRGQGDGTLRERLALLAEHRTALRERIAAWEQHEAALTIKVDTYRRMLADAERSGACDD